MRMGGVQARLAYSIYYDLTEDIVEDFIYFQFVVQFINAHNELYDTYEHVTLLVCNE